MRILSTRPLRATRLLDRVRERIRYDHYSLRTEQAYVYWVRRFIRFHHLQHPRALGGPEVEQFLTHLATSENVAASTHRQALAAVLYLYRRVLGTELPWMNELGRPRATARVPVVLSREEVARLLAAMTPEYRLIASVLYGAGLRLRECLSLRVKDLDFARGVIIVRDGKGGKDRAVMLPGPLRDGLRAQLVQAHSLWGQDVVRGVAGVEVPDALHRKYPRLGSSWPWFWVFPANTISRDPRTRTRRRHHLYPQGISRALSRATAQAAIAK